MADEKQRLHTLLEGFENGMLVTRTPAGQLRSRPMAIADVAPDGGIWFVTDRKTAKIDEVERHPEVNVALQSGRRFVSLSGTARIVDDRQKLDEVWNESWKVWFPDGKQDPNVIMLKVEAEEGEYWDNSATNPVRYLLEVGRAYMNNERPKVDEDEQLHGKVRM